MRPATVDTAKIGKNFDKIIILSVYKIQSLSSADAERR